MLKECALTRANPQNPPRPPIYRDDCHLVSKRSRFSSSHQELMNRFAGNAMGAVTILCLAIRCASGEVKPNGLFVSGAVLQQGMRLPVWGTAGNGESVTVRFQDQSVTTTTKSGRWMVRLQPLKAGGPFSLSIVGSNTLVLTNILVGEVWLCSGQSNMEMPLSATTNASEAIAAAHDSGLRLFTVPHRTADEPFTEISGTWKETSPDTAKYFSAVAYYFGPDLRAALKVPVGLIHSSVGGTPAEAWTALATLEADPELKSIVETYARSVKSYDPAKAEANHQAALAKARAEGRDELKVPGVAKNPASSFGRPAGLYNAMITPLQPFGLAGVIWYQGESNNGRARQYQRLFPAMIRNWREAWAEGDFPFLFVQICPHRDMTPELREVQLRTWQTVPQTAMVVTTDVGEASDIHPKRKEPVGKRLALAARAVAYRGAIEYSGPVFDSMQVEGNRAILRFTHIGGGLIAKDGELKGFAVAGTDHKFSRASAVIAGDQVLVSNPSLSAPTAVRYGWANVPDGNLFNAQGLPATPFRTDTE
jgi:sialate O-acetylesterase